MKGNLISEGTYFQFGSIKNINKITIPKFLNKIFFEYGTKLKIAFKVKPPVMILHGEGLRNFQNCFHTLCN